MVRTCCICQHTFESGGETFVLTDEEKAAIGKDAPNEVEYCSACLRVMRDRESGAQLLKGLYEMRLREIGVPSTMAHGMAERIYQRLVTDKGKVH